MIAVTNSDAPPVILHLAAALIPAHLMLVVLDLDKTPVAGASVAVHLVTASANLLSDDHAADFSATCSADGRAEFKHIPLRPLVIDANTPDGRRGTLLLDDDRRRYANGRVFVVVAPTGGIDGSLSGATSEQLRGSSVRALEILLPEQAYYSSFGRVHVAPVVETGFQFTSLAAGVYALELESPAGLRLELGQVADTPNSVTPLTVTVNGALVTKITAPVVEGGALAGSVLTLEGQPIAGARVEAVLTPVSANLADGFAMFGAHVWRLDSAESLALNHPSAHPGTRTDSQGAYQIVGMTPGNYRVDIFAPGHSFDQRLDVAVRVAATTQLEHRLSAAGVIQGNAMDITYLGAVPKGKEHPVMLSVLPGDGLFTLPGIAAGDYTLASFPSDTSHAWEPLVELHVDAGRTTWVDLSRAGSLHFAGRLVDASGRPVVGTLTLFGQRIRTQSDGSFAFQRSPTVGRPLYWPDVLVEVDGLQWRVPFSDDIRRLDARFGQLVLGDQTLEVELRDADGRLTAGTLEVSGEHIVSSRIAIGADGRATLRHLFDGEYGVGAEMPDAIVTPQTVELPETTSLELKALASAPIQVSVVDEQGRPAAGIRVFASVWQGSDPPPSDQDEFVQKSLFYETTSDYDGRARILAPSGLVLVSATGWYIGDPSARQMITSVRGQVASVALTVR